jgi:hypothetical protein
LTDEALVDKKLSRRQFMGTAAAGAAALGAVAGATTLLPHVAAIPSEAGVKALDAARGLKTASPVPKPAQALRAGVTVGSGGITSSWDYSADVVIIGTGLSGLSTAITAYDAGANVLLLEKMPQEYEGGNSKVSGNVFYTNTNVALAAEYMKAMDMANYKLGYLDDSIINAVSAGIQENMSVVTQMGGKVTGIPDPEFPLLPGSSNALIQAIVINGVPQLGNGHLWQLFRDAVASRNINVMYNTPATELIQSGDTGEILGVTAVGSGGTINIQANKAVVLACGGFEFNHAMQVAYLPGFPIYGWGTPGNTGDGIQMAQKVGADLWHMNTTSGGSPGAIVVPDYPYPMGALLGPSIGDNYIWVGKDGNRFANESLGFASHGWGVKEYGFQFYTDGGATGSFLRIPCWVVFDDTARKAGPFVPTVGVASVGVATEEMGWFLWNSGYTWSSDNSAEIAKGWITQADSIADLAASIASDTDDLNPTGQPFMTANALQATVTAFNGFATSGTDSAFGRPKATMAPIQTAPFYAVKVWPVVVNTNGGPRRNVNCQIVDPDSNPIPRLYGVGECGSFWGWMYQGGGNLAECMWTGRVAGANAAAETPWA